MRRRAVATSGFTLKVVPGARTSTPGQRTAVPGGSVPPRRLRFDSHANAAAGLVALQEATSYGLRQSGTSPLAVPAVIPGIAVVAAVPFQLPHRLGKIPQGFLAHDGNGQPWQGFRLPPKAGAVGPSGQLQEVDYLTIMPLVTGTYGFTVF